MPEPHVYPIEDRPDAEVLVDGTWWPAELRMRTERPDGYWYNAAWHSTDGTRLDTFHQDHVRADTVDPGRRTCARGAPGTLTNPDTNDTHDTQISRSTPYTPSDLRPEHR